MKPHKLVQIFFVLFMAAIAFEPDQSLAIDILQIFPAINVSAKNRDLVGNSCDTATVFPINGDYATRIENSSDVDFFKLTLSADGFISIGGSSVEEIDGALFNSSCQQIALGNSDTNNTAFNISQTLPVGSYYVRVTGKNGSTGNYNLHSTFTALNSDDHGNTCATATNLASTGSATGKIETAGDVDFFKIELPATQKLILSTTGSTDTYGTLYDNSCNLLASNNDTNTTNSNFLLTANIRAGTYYVKVSGYGSSTTGEYRINSSTHVTNIDIPLDLDEGRSGYIAAGTGNDYYSLTVNASGTLTYSISTSDPIHACLYINGAINNCTNATYKQRSAQITAGDYLIAIFPNSESASGKYYISTSFQQSGGGGGGGGGSTECDDLYRSWNLQYDKWQICGDVYGLYSTRCSAYMNAYFSIEQEWASKCKP